MLLPQGVSSVGYGGDSYIPDKNGVVEVPDDAVYELMRHGLTITSKPVEKPPEKAHKPKPAQKKKGVQK